MSQAYSKVGGTEVQEVEEASHLIDAIRNEHARVYMQNQALLSIIKEKRPQLDYSHVIIKPNEAGGVEGEPPHTQGSKTAESQKLHTVLSVETKNSVVCESNDASGQVSPTAAGAGGVSTADQQDAKSGDNAEEVTDAGEANLPQ